MLKKSYEYDGDELAVWDLFGGSNTNVCESFKDLRYYQNRWYVMSFVYEDIGVIKKIILHQRCA